MELSIDNADTPIYTVGQVSTMLSVQPAFLRRLDAEDVVSPDRTDGGQRRYSRGEIHQVQRVSEMMGEGFTLAGIRRILLLEAEVNRLQAEVAELRRKRPNRGRSQ